MATRDGRGPARLLIAFAGVAAMAAASAQTVVTACASDSAGPGMNLRNAVAAGGRIIFDCGAAPVVIPVAAPLPVAAPVQIEGGDRVTLLGPGNAPIFNAKARLELRQLNVRNPSPKAAGIVRSSAEVVLRGVQTKDTASAYAALALDATDSVFEANGDPAAPAGVLIDAERVRIVGGAFRNNADHPLGGGLPSAGRAPLSRQYIIEDAIFNGNRGSLLMLDAQVQVRRTRFEQNGAAPPAAGGGSWGCCGGAITAVHSQVEIADSEFAGNGSAGFGGAVLAIASELRIRQTLFTANRARVGGAVFSWAQPAKNNVWSTPGEAVPAPRLAIARARFRDNVATFGGGAIAWSGALGGDQALFAGNQSDAGGAIAHWSAAPLPAEFQRAFDELVVMTTPTAQSLQLARAVFADNRARAEGAAIHGGKALVALGSGLLVRNVLTSPGSGAALEAAAMELANVSIADNSAGGVRLIQGGQAQLRNMIVLRNASYGCHIPAAQMPGPVANLQFPASDCAGATSRDPELDGAYKPSTSGITSTSGDLATCLTAPLVAALDLTGTARGNHGSCAVGAYEADPSVDSVTGWTFRGQPWWRLGLLFLMLLFLLLGLVIALRRAHSRTCGT